MSKKYIVLFCVLGLMVGAVSTIAVQTMAQDTSSSLGQNQAGCPWHNSQDRPVIMGQVTAVNGNSIAVTDKRTNTSYTVEAGSATIQKFTPPVSGDNTPKAPVLTTISITEIAVGDNVSVSGTVSGTNVSATQVVVGMMGRGGRFEVKGPKGQGGTWGTVTAINGNTITLTGSNGATYTINAENAAVKKVISTNVSGIAVGDTLMVRGTISGNNITATSIMDGAAGKGFGKGGGAD